MFDSTEFRRVLGHYPTGIAVITASDDDGAHMFMVVGTFTSVSLDPPLIGFLPTARSERWKRIEACRRFCVTVLAADQEQACRALSRKGATDLPALDWRRSVHGLPTLAGSVGWFDCELHAICPAGDHDFVTARVVAMEADADRLPLLFLQGRYRTLA